MHDKDVARAVQPPEPRRGSTAEMVERINRENGLCPHGVMLAYFCEQCCSHNPVRTQICDWPEGE